jgi:hypothetical protein
MTDERELSIIGVRLPEGRVGSTLLMQLLATSPEVVFDTRYPAEYRFASYFARMAQAMTEPFDPEKHLGVTPFFFGPTPGWGPVPFASDVVDVAALGPPLVRSMWRTWSAAAIQRRPGARFYAEKLAVPVDALLDAGLDVRVIDLVRDPRDMLASIRSFVSRGIDGFGRRPDQDDDAWLADLVVRLRENLDRAASTPASVDRITFRYEDLAGDLHAAADRLGAWLGVSFDADAVIAQRTDYEHHMTSATVDDSIGRWRRDLPPVEAALLTSELHDHLRALGYDTSS